MGKRGPKNDGRIPNPGSDEAIAIGCLCPVADNRHGAGMARNVFVMQDNCPLHSKKTKARYWGKHGGVSTRKPTVNLPDRIMPRAVISAELGLLGSLITGFSADYLLNALERAARRLYPKAKYVALVSFGKSGWRFVEAVRLPAKEEA